jgi:hypothetical protein
MGWGSVKVTKHKLRNTPTYGGWDSFDTFSSAQQKEYEQWYKNKYGTLQEPAKEDDIEFKAPENYSANIEHHRNFYSGIREAKPIVEDALFGMQAAGPALASNKSLFEKKIIEWNPDKAKLV